jgi:hypothetical protein
VGRTLTVGIDALTVEGVVSDADQRGRASDSSGDVMTAIIHW